MFISPAFPPLPIDGIDEICRHDGMYGIDPISSIVGSVGGAAGSIVTALKKSEDEKRRVALEKAQLKSERERTAIEFAMTQAKTIQEPYAKHRRDQIIALVAVGVVASVVAGIFLYSTVKKD